jgi:transcription antitermination factor NusG
MSLLLAGSPRLTHPEASTDLEAPWFAVAVKPRHEKCVTRLMEYKGITSWLPIEERTHRYGVRLRKFEVPLFPGYVFCQLQPAAHMPVVTTPGVLRIAGIGRTPIPLDQAEVQSIRTAALRRAHLRPCEYLEGGEQVRIVAGSLAGVTGTVVSTVRPFRVRLSITLLQRAVLLEIDSDDVIVEYVAAPRIDHSLRQRTHAGV